MHKIIIIAIAAIFSMSSAVAMSDKDICQMRAELMGAMAIERDKGKTKTQVKALINKNMTTTEIANRLYELCQQGKFDIAEKVKTLCNNTELT